MIDAIKEIRDKIAEIESSHTRRTAPNVIKRWICSKKNEELLNALMTDPAVLGDTLMQRLYSVKHGLSEQPACKVCGSHSCKFVSYSKGYKETCSKRCFSLLKYGVEHPMQSKQVQENLKSVILEKYGVDNPSKSAEVKRKMKETFVRNYGVDNPHKCKKIRDKTVATNVERYGAPTPLLNESVKEKAKQTNLKKYGTEKVLESSAVWDKIRASNLEKHGVEYNTQREDVKEKMRQACLEKYGVDNAIKDSGVRAKVQATCKERYGTKTPLESRDIYEKTVSTSISKYGAKTYTASRDYLDKSFERFREKIEAFVEPLFDRSEFDGMRSDKLLKWRCARCGSVFEQSMTGSHLPPTVTKYQYVPRCWKCYHHAVGRSSPEDELLDFCKQFDADATKNDKSLIGVDLDIVMPTLKIAIEYNGVYYHSTIFKKPGFHLSKTLACNEIGYRLIHVWEDEWVGHEEAMKEKLAKAFNGVEEADFAEDELTLDRSWYNGVRFSGYSVIEYEEPKLVKRGKFDVEDCGSIILRKRT